MRSAEDIYKILTSQKANYVIIEESICNELSPNKGCRIKDLLDIANAHVSQRSFYHKLHDVENHGFKVHQSSFWMIICWTKSSRSTVQSINVKLIKSKNNCEALMHYIQ